MTKNIVICCDGTGNEIRADLSNVLKLFRILKKDDDQLVYYDPGIGTLASDDPWSKWKNDAGQVFALATGYGLDANVLDAYCFLMQEYQEGDHLYLFGFSRGAYTVRVLAGFLRLVGLLQRPQANLSKYALTAYKKAAAENNFEIAWRFERIAGTRRVPIKFIGVWDTVSSVIVPRPDRFYIPSLVQLPYTRTNSYVEHFRQAMAIDERRSMFRINQWAEPQEYKPNPFDPNPAANQDVKQVWFCGDHSDVGGGYPEQESGLAKFPLKWMVDEASGCGLRTNTVMYNHLILGKPRQGGSREYVSPDPFAKMHNSLTLPWKILEVWPKSAARREWQSRRSIFGWYLPLGEPRFIPEGARVHDSVFQRMTGGVGYAPVNLPPPNALQVEP